MTKTNMEPLLANAVESIKMGIEDYALDTPGRALSAVRNFYAGVLLLGKEALIRAAPHADPDVIIGIRYKPVPDGKGGATVELDGSNTIDFRELGERFKTFAIPISTSALTELNWLRNAIEHKYTDQPAKAVREVIARAFPVTVALFHNIGVHPSEVLGEAWTTLLKVRDLYQAELARCRATLEAIRWLSPTVADQHLCCTECSSELVEQRDLDNDDQEEMDLVCRSCGESLDWAETIEQAIDLALGVEEYIRHKDTSEPGPIYDCPSCERHSFIEGEEACAVCGEGFDWERNCVVCNSAISMDDARAGFDGGLCSYCTHIANKDD